MDWCRRFGWLVVVPAMCAVAAEDMPDWVPREELPAALQSRVPALCQGVFLEPVFAFESDTDDAVRASANSATFRIGEGGQLFGDVLIHSGPRRLTTDRAFLDQASGDVTLEGNVTFRQPGLLLQGARGQYNLNENTAQVGDARYVMHESGAHGRAEVVAYDGEHTLLVRRGRFTRCEPGAEAWALESRRIRIDQETKQGTATGAVLRLGGVPVFFIPYIRFPVTDERQSGFLVPEAGFSQENGFDIALPYYFNLAPNYDMTVTPRMMSERGILSEIEIRHLARIGHTTVGGAYMPRDDQFDGRFSKDDFKIENPNGDFDPAKRWLLVLEHASRLNRIRTLVDYSAASDDEYFRDLGSNLEVSSRTELRRFGEIAYFGDALHLRLYGEGYQALEDDVDDSYRRIPALDIGYARALWDLPMEVGFEAQMTRFDRSQHGLTGRDRIIGNRIHLAPKIALNLLRSFGHLRISFDELLTYYDLEDLPPGFDSSPSRTLARASLDGKLVFERAGKRGWQTIEPRIYYQYTEFEDQDELPEFDTAAFTFGYGQLYRDNPFTGLDRIQDANRVSVGFTSRLIGQSGVERLTINAGQIHYFRDRRVALAGTPTGELDDDYSPVAADLTWRPARNFLVSSSLVWDVDARDIDETGVAFRYTPGAERIVNIGYRHRAQSLDQTDVTFYWPLSRRFRVFGRWNYDVERSQTVEGFGGIEFDACCWRLRVLGRRLLRSSTIPDRVRSDKGVFIQVILKGLAGLGGQAESVMTGGIAGYEDMKDGI